MWSKHLIVVFVLLSCSCKTLHEHTTHTMPAATVPGTCNIEGVIVDIIPPSAADSGTICAKYSCRAKVKIQQVYGCASAVSIAVHGDDVVEMQFAYTLHCTEIFPDMKTRFPGLRKGDVFQATVKQHMAMGAAEYFVVDDYRVE